MKESRRQAKSAKAIRNAEKRGDISPEQAAKYRKVNTKMTHVNDQREGGSSPKRGRRRGR